MKRKILIGFLLLFFHFSFAQQDSAFTDNIDGLYKQMAILKQNCLEHDKNIIAIQKDLSLLQDSILKLNSELDIVSLELHNKMATNEAASEARFDTIYSRLYAMRSWGVVAIILAIIFLVCIFIYSVVQIRRCKKSYQSLDQMQKILSDNTLSLDNHVVEILSNQLRSNEDKNVVDHTMALQIASEISRVETNLYRMDPSVRGHKQLTASINRIKDTYLANGYELVDMLGKKYHEGMLATVNFVGDDGLEEGMQIITGISKPQVNYHGKMIQSASITVSQN